MVTSLQAVLLDMDGLLVDSEPLWFGVEAAVFRRLGATREWTHAEARSLVGNTLTTSAAQMISIVGADVEPSVVAEWFVDGMGQTLAAGAPFKPGARRLLADLGAHGVPTALVSSSYRRLVDVVLAQLAAQAPAVSVAGDEVSRGKPHPEPYERALALLGASADRAVVLEDSPTGATAGDAAGCAVVVVPDLAPLPPAHPWTVVDSLERVDIGLLERLATR